MQRILAGKIVRENLNINFSLDQMFGAIGTSYLRCEPEVRRYIIDLGYQTFLTADQAAVERPGDFISTLAGPIFVEQMGIAAHANAYVPFVKADMEAAREDMFFVLGYLEILKRLDTETGEVEYSNIAMIERTVDVTATFLVECMRIHTDGEMAKLL